MYNPFKSQLKIYTLFSLSSSFWQLKIRYQCLNEYTLMKRIIFNKMLPKISGLD